MLKNDEDKGGDLLVVVVVRSSNDYPWLQNSERKEY